MSDDEIIRLEREIAEKTARLQALKQPMSLAETRELARTDPDEFNRRADAGLVPVSALGAQEG